MEECCLAAHGLCAVSFRSCLIRRVDEFSGVTYLMSGMHRNHEEGDRDDSAVF